jgi:transcriptional regulator with XRE-family HTH domain
MLTQEMDDNASELRPSWSGESPVKLRRQIGSRVRDARLAARRTQADVAGAAAVSVPTLQRFEAGANVSFDVVLRVAIVLNSLHWLDKIFEVPDTRTIDELLQRRRVLPQRGRRRRN